MVWLETITALPQYYMVNTKMPKFVGSNSSPLFDRLPSRIHHVDPMHPLRRWNLGLLKALLLATESGRVSTALRDNIHVTLAEKSGRCYIMYILYIYIYIHKYIYICIQTPDTPSETRNRNHGHVSFFSTSATGIAPATPGCWASRYPRSAAFVAAPSRETWRRAATSCGGASGGRAWLQCGAPQLRLLVYKPQYCLTIYIYIFKYHKP